LRRRVQQGERAPPKRRALGKVQHAEAAQRVVAQVECTTGGRVLARDVGGALIGVELRIQAQRQPQAAELLGATMIAV
jgi:hypothetical protein